MKPALALVALALVTVLAAGWWGPKPAAPSPNGDQLGQDSGESFAAYVERADSTLGQADDDRQAWALVTFATPLGPEDAATATAGLGRVSAVVISGWLLQEAPEPVPGSSRAEVFARQAAGGPLEEGISGVVAFATGRQLRQCAKGTPVAAVEVLPADAVWGRFGVRPVYPGQVGVQPDELFTFLS